MKYNGFYVKNISLILICIGRIRTVMIFAKGFTIEVFADESEKLEIDVFSAAVDFELLLEDSLEEVEQFAKDYIDCEEKEYRRMSDEFNEH